MLESLTSCTVSDVQISRSSGILEWLEDGAITGGWMNKTARRTDKRIDDPDDHGRHGSLNSLVSISAEQMPGESFDAFNLISKTLLPPALRSPD
jgi:hypothetical protein